MTKKQERYEYILEWTRHMIPRVRDDKLLSWLLQIVVAHCLERIPAHQQQH